MTATAHYLSRDEPRHHRLFLDTAGWEGLASKLVDPFFVERARDNRLALNALHTLTAGRLDQVPARLDRPQSPLGTLAWRVVKARLMRSTTAWWLERQQEDLDDARATVAFLLAEPWTTHFHACGARLADLRTGDLAYCAAFALDVLGPLLGPGQEDGLRQRLTSELLPNYLRAVADSEWWVCCDHNWNPAVHGNTGLGALAVLDTHPQLAAEVLACAKRHLRLTIAALPAGGGWIEGAMYQATQLGHLTDFIAALHRVTGDDLGLLTHPRLIDAFEHRCDLIAPDGIAYNFSDIDEGVCEWLLPQAYWWAEKMGKPQWTAFEDAHPKSWWDVHGLFHDVETFWYRPVDPVTSAPPQRRLHHFSGLDWVAWRGEGGWLALRGGRLGGNHGNWDLGQIIFGTGTQRWLIDPGYGELATARHNAVTIHGRNQADCAHGRVIRIDDRPGRLHLAIDLRQAYPHVLDRHVRHVLVLDGTTLVIVDDLCANAGRPLHARFHYQVRGDVTMAGNGATLRQGDAQAVLAALDSCTDFTCESIVHRGNTSTSLSWRPVHDAPAGVYVTCLAVDAAIPRCERQGRILVMDGLTLDLDACLVADDR